MASLYTHCSLAAVNNALLYISENAQDLIYLCDVACGMFVIAQAEYLKMYLLFY
jgi:hypothetical protein